MELSNEVSATLGAIAGRSYWFAAQTLEDEWLEGPCKGTLGVDRPLGGTYLVLVLILLSCFYLLSSLSFGLFVYYYGIGRYPASQKQSCSPQRLCLKE